MKVLKNTLKTIKWEEARGVCQQDDAGSDLASDLNSIDFLIFEMERYKCSHAWVGVSKKGNLWKTVLGENSSLNVSGDGNYVAFESTSKNFTALDSDSQLNCYVCQQMATLVSKKISTRD